MNQLIDRRLNGRNRSAVNRERFLRRYRERIRAAVAGAVKTRSITDLDRGEKIDIPRRDIDEPHFDYGAGGVREAVHPGNREFAAGERIARPPAGGAGGGDGEASQDGGGEDAFAFVLSREEFLRFFFEDLELPDLVKTQLATLRETRQVRAGFSRTGVPGNLNVVRSLKSAAARRRALQAPYFPRLRAAEAQLQALLDAGQEDGPHVAALREEVQRLRRRVQAVPFIDGIDLRYNNRAPQPRPTAQAVMFCLLDVSASMDEARKDLAKRFFALLYMFLERSYETTRVVFIRHHTHAAEVEESQFFSARDTGGTIVSSALELMGRIIEERFPAGDWNIYAAQASDGDNWFDDSPRCRELLVEKLMPRLQYYAYVQIAAPQEQGLWQAYADVAGRCRNFAMRKIDGPAEIYPVFRELFRRRTA